MLKLVVEDLKSKADPSEERDARVALLKDVAKLVANLDLKDIKLEGAKAVFVQALDTLLKRIP